jgi:hypothetical protein
VARILRQVRQFMRIGFKIEKLIGIERATIVFLISPD